MAGGSLLLLFDQLKNVKFSLFSMWVWNNIRRVCVRIMKIELFFLFIGLVLHSCTGFWEFFDMGVVVVLRRCLLALVVKCVYVLEYNGQMADELAQMAPHLPIVFDQLQHVKLSLFLVWVWNNTRWAGVRIMRNEPFWFGVIVMVFGNSLIFYRSCSA